MRILNLLKKDKNKHPKELFPLALIGMAMRFSFWGVGNLLVIYLMEVYHSSPADASHLYGMFAGVSSFLPLIGGVLADRWNYHGPIFLGMLITASGCFLIAFHNYFLLHFALVLIACGYGIFIPAIFPILNHAYREKSHLRESGFSLYYGTFNIGVFLALVSLGYIAHKYSWGLAFIIAGCVMLLGFIPTIWFYKKYYVNYKNIHPKSSKKASAPLLSLKKHEKDHVIVILILSLITICFWTNYAQGWSSMSVFALHYTDKNFLGFNIPAAWILSLESLFLILLIPLFTKVYSYLNKIEKNPSPIMKSSISLFITSLIFVVMIIGTFNLPHHITHASVSVYYLIIAYFLMAISEILIAPIGLSLVTNLSPKKFIALLIGFWYVCLGASYYIGGLLAGLIQKIPSLYEFFSIFFFIAIIPAVGLLLFSKKLKAMCHEEKL